MHDGHDAGEILARGPGVFSGYLNLPDKTAEAFTDDGWFRTGDLGFLDDRGDLHLAGRRSTVIVTESGEKVQPDAVEDAYQQHPAIGEIAVLGRNGRLVGLIVPKADTGDGAARGPCVERWRRFRSGCHLTSDLPNSR